MWTNWFLFLSIAAWWSQGHSGWASLWLHRYYSGHTTVRTLRQHLWPSRFSPSDFRQSLPRTPWSLLLSRLTFSPWYRGNGCRPNGLPRCLPWTSRHKLEHCHHTTKKDVIINGRWCQRLIRKKMPLPFMGVFSTRILYQKNVWKRRPKWGITSSTNSYSI